MDKLGSASPISLIVLCLCSICLDNLWWLDDTVMRLSLNGKLKFSCMIISSYCSCFKASHECVSIYHLNMPLHFLFLPAECMYFKFMNVASYLTCCYFVADGRDVGQQSFSPAGKPKPCMKFFRCFPSFWYLSSSKIQLLN